MRKAVIILPTYNEKGNIEKLIHGIFESTKSKTNWEIHVLVVDSTSTDETAEIVKHIQEKNKKVHLLETPKEGLGKAYIKGFHHALNTFNPFLIFEMDADLSHNPKSLPEFLTKIEEGADFVLGTRYVAGGSIPKNWGIHRKFLSIFGNIIIRLGFMKPQITDWTGGFRAIKSWIIKDAIPHVENQTGYVFQVALLDFALKHNARIAEVPINFADRTYGISKINFAQTMVQTLLYIFMNSSFVKFIIVGGLGFVIDVGIFYYLTQIAHWVSWHANLLSTETAVVSNFLLNNFWSFSHKKLENTAPSIISSFLKFNFVSAGNILIQTIGVEICKHIFGPQLLVVYKVLIIFFVVIPYSYFFYNRFIWKSK